MYEYGRYSIAGIHRRVDLPFRRSRCGLADNDSEDDDEVILTCTPSCQSKQVCRDGRCVEDTGSSGSSSGGSTGGLAGGGTSSGGMSSGNQVQLDIQARDGDIYIGKLGLASGDFASFTFENYGMYTDSSGNQCEGDLHSDNPQSG